MRATPLRLLLAVVVLTTGVLWSTVPGEAHKAITSKFHFNDEVFPVFREHCGRCHVEGGVAPMSLMTYDDAFPWAESLRIELLADTIPVWHPLALSARDLDVVLVWATGGAPRGDAEKAPPPVVLENTWASGAPDVQATMPEPFTLGAAESQATHQVELTVAGATGKTIGALDLLPGNPAIVRGATILLKTSPGAEPRELGEWWPGRSAAVVLPAPVQVPAGASLIARIRYKRTWKYEGQDMDDASTVGLYYAKPTSRAAARR